MTINATSLGSYPLWTLPPTEVVDKMAQSHFEVSGFGTYTWLKPVTDFRERLEFVFKGSYNVLYSVLEWWEARKGSLEAFWTLSWRRELVPVGECQAAFITARADYGESWDDTRRIAVVTKDTIWVRRVDYIYRDAGRDFLVLDEATDKIPPEEVILACRVLLVRFDADRLSVKWRPLTRTGEVRVPLLEVVGELPE